MTQAMKVECAGSSIVAEIEIAAPPETVFDALTMPDDLAAWWGAEGVYRTHDWKIDLRPGGEWSCLATQAGDGAVMTVRGAYLEVDRPRALAYTWMPSWEPQMPATEVRYTLSAVGGGTLVQVEHTGFAGYQKSQEGHVMGWKRVFEWLSAYCTEKAVAK
jgi:uncharacterized protein YndB with AHSA1/START domain